MIPNSHMPTNRHERRCAYKSKILEISKARQERAELVEKERRCNHHSGGNFWRKYYKQIALKKARQDFLVTKGRMILDRLILRGLRHNPFAKPIRPTLLASGIARALRGF